MTKEEKAIYNLNYRIKNAKKLKLNRELNSEKIKKEKAEYYKKNKNKIKEKNAKYRADNPEKIKNNNLKNRKINSEKIKIYLSNYREKNKDKTKKYNAYYHRNRKKKDLIYKLRINISSLIRMSFKSKNYKKPLKTENILGCSLLEFKLYIESKLEPWMNDKNYGIYKPNQERTWNIDHIIPLSTAKTKEDVIKLNHYTNLRPLCSKENLEKRDNIIL